MIYVIIVWVLCVFFWAKNANTFHKTQIISDAIYKYAIDCIYTKNNQLVNYDDKRGYTMTLLRFWDWGYKKILSPEKFQIIEKYIDKRDVL